MSEWVFFNTTSQAFLLPRNHIKKEPGVSEALRLSLEAAETDDQLASKKDLEKTWKTQAPVVMEDVLSRKKNK